MKVQIDEVWVSSGALVCRVVIWGENGEWRQKRYAAIALQEIPDEVITDLVGHYLDAGADEDLEALPGL